MKARLSHLFNNKGETIIEMLVSVLIGALATALLATTIAAAVRTTKNVDKYDTTLRADIEAAETQNGTGSSGSIKFSGTNETTVNVKFYGNQRMMSFRAVK